MKVLINKTERKGKEMDQSNYFIKERQDDHGVVTVIYTPKERECEFCNKVNSTRKMEVLRYRDKDGYRRVKELCLHCYKLLKPLT
jgi:hypothetical protein